MVKVMGISTNPDTMKATVSLFADTKTEVTSGMTIEGMPSGYEIEAGSSVMTASAEVAFMKSNGSWNWV